MKNDVDKNPVDRLPAVLRQDLDKNLCTCMDVSKMDIINAIVNGATTVDEVKKITFATMGSGCCVQQIERLIEFLNKPEPRKRSRRSRHKTGG